MLNAECKLRFGVSSMRSRVAAGFGGSVLKFVAVGLLAGASAACSDSGRFSGNPFTNPFSAAPTAKVDRITTNSASTRAAPVGQVTSQPLPSALPSTPSTPRVASPVLQNASPIGGSAAGWTAMGGTSVTVGPNDNANTLSARYGVPVAAINNANGGIIRPGGQAVIPVFRGTGDGQAKAGLMNPAPRQTAQVQTPSPAPAAAPQPAPTAAPAPARTTAQLPPQRPAAAQPAQPTLRQAAKPAIVPAKPAAKAEDDDDDEEEDVRPQKRIVAAAPKAGASSAPQPVPPAPRSAQPQVQAAPRRSPG